MLWYSYCYILYMHIDLIIPIGAIHMSAMKNKLMFTSRAMSWDKMAKTIMKSIHCQELHCHIYFLFTNTFLKLH